jgi:polysaccharide biosynthesis/export protein
MYLTGRSYALCTKPFLGASGRERRGEMKCKAVVLWFGLVTLGCVAPAQNALTADRAADGGATAYTGPDRPGPQLSDPHARYRLHAGDTFDVDFTLSPEFNQTVAVQPDGYASFKAVGTIFVQGKTIPELTEAIRTAYVQVLHEPLVVVVLKDFEKPYFVATGQVARPGKYDLRTDLTLAEALAIAGGVNDKAKITSIVLYHRTEGGFAGTVFNLKKLLSARNLSEDPRLQPGDLVYVPQNTFSHFRPFLPTASMGAYYNPTRY